MDIVYITVDIERQCIPVAFQQNTQGIPVAIEIAGEKLFIAECRCRKNSSC